jgi:hypothetical protein
VCGIGSSFGFRQRVGVTGVVAGRVEKRSGRTDAHRQQKEKGILKRLQCKLEFTRTTPAKNVCAQETSTTSDAQRIITPSLKCSVISVSAIILSEKQSTGLGNFSPINPLIQGGLGIDPAKLSAAVYKDDHEAAKIWLEKIRLPLLQKNVA